PDSLASRPPYSAAGSEKGRQRARTTDARHPAEAHGPRLRDGAARARARSCGHPPASGARGAAPSRAAGAPRAGRRPRAGHARHPELTEVKGAARRIERGRREDATGSGVPPRVVSELADIFSWELDLESDLRPGDEFRVLYENTRQAAEAVAVTVIAAEIIAGGRELTAVFFEDDDGHGAYYPPSGEPPSRA